MPSKKVEPFVRGLALAAAAWLSAEMWRGGIPWTPAFFLACLAPFAYPHGARALWKRRPAAVVFCSALALYLSTFRWRGGDDGPNSLLPLCLLKHGTLALDSVIDPWFNEPAGKLENFTVLAGGRRLSIFPPAAGLMAAPLYLVPVLSGAPISEPFLHNLSKLSAALMTAGSAAFLYAAMRARASESWALTLVTAYAAGSWAFSVSSQGLWQHGPSQLAVALALWGFAQKGRTGGTAAGFGLALSAAARPDSVFFLAAGTACVLLHHRRRLPCFAAGAAAPLLLQAAYWLYYTGRLSPPESEFQSRIFMGFSPEAFAALLASPSRGLLFFFPLAAFGAWAAWRRRDEPLVFWLALACLGPWVLLSCYKGFTGGNTFGPRYFATAAVVLTWLCTGVEREVRKSPHRLTLFCAAAAFGILVHAEGAYFAWPPQFHFETISQNLWRWDLHPLVLLATSSGGLGAFTAPVRAATVAAWLAAGAGLAACARRRLELP